jgi:hypothetical protein
MQVLILEHLFIFKFVLFPFHRNGSPLLFSATSCSGSEIGRKSRCQNSCIEIDESATQSFSNGRASRANTSTMSQQLPTVFSQQFEDTPVLSMNLLCRRCCCTVRASPYCLPNILPQQKLDYLKNGDDP